MKPSDFGIQELASFEIQIRRFQGTDLHCIPFSISHQIDGSIQVEYSNGFHLKTSVEGRDNRNGDIMIVI